MHTFQKGWQKVLKNGITWEFKTILWIVITRKEFWQHHYGLQHSSNQDWKSRAIRKKSTSCWKGFVFAFAATLSIASGRGDLVPSFKLEMGVKETFPIHESSWSWEFLSSRPQICFRISASGNILWCLFVWMEKALLYRIWIVYLEITMNL